MNLKSVKSRDELDLVEIKTFREAIRAKCYDCCVYDLNEVKHCQAFSCPLWAFRLGKKPKPLARVNQTKYATSDFWITKIYQGSPRRLICPTRCTIWHHRELSHRGWYIYTP